MCGQRACPGQGKQVVYGEDMDLIRHSRRHPSVNSLWLAPNDTISGLPRNSHQGGGGGGGGDTNDHDGGRRNGHWNRDPIEARPPSHIHQDSVGLGWMAKRELFQIMREKQSWNLKKSILPYPGGGRTTPLRTEAKRRKLLVHARKGSAK